MSNPPRRGFVCPVCLTLTAVANTQRPAADLVVRYRCCPNCDYAVVTEERVAKHRNSTRTHRPARPAKKELNARPKR